MGDGVAVEKAKLMDFIYSGIMIEQTLKNEPRGFGHSTGECGTIRND
jgi:hypothetical protein